MKVRLGYPLSYYLSDYSILIIILFWCSYGKCSIEPLILSLFPNKLSNYLYIILYKLLLVLPH